MTTPPPITPDEANPKWTVLYNIVSAESDRWVGTGWEFFDNEEDAQRCRNRLDGNGHCVTFRPYHRNDGVHLGAAHCQPSVRALRRTIKSQQVEIERLRETLGLNVADRNVAAVVQKHQARAAAGLLKYGVTTERTDLSFNEWLNHLQDELMDAAVYIERIKLTPPAAKEG